MHITRSLILAYIFVFVSCKESIAVIEQADRNCNFKSKTSPQNIVLLSDSINAIYGTWNHINTINDEWNGVTKPASNYAVSKQPTVFSNSCFKGPVFSGILVKKYGDWEHQHANGYVIKPLENDIPIGSVNKIFLDIYYDPELSNIPDLDKIKSVYGHLLSDAQIESWDNGLFNLDIQIQTNNKNTLALNLTLTREMADKWLRIEISLKNMEGWNNDKKPIKYKDIAKDTIQVINLTAETKSRLVYRNLDTKNFNIEATPKLFKEIAFRIKRFELEKK